MSPKPSYKEDVERESLTQPTGVTTMNLKELLAVAKNYAIVGRHDMSKADLEIAVNNAANLPQEVELDEDVSVDDEAEIFVSKLEAEAEAAPIVDPEVIKDTKRRYPSSAKRDSLGKVVRRGIRFNMNTPFANKFYYLPAHLANDAEWTDAYRAAVSAAPPQAQLIVKSMGRLGITSPSEALIGGAIVDAAKSRGGLSTRTGSRELFAYYRRLLEKLGVVHCGSAPGEED